MRRGIIHLLMVIVGASLGIALLPALWNLANQANNELNQDIVNGIIGALIFLILSFIFVHSILNFLSKIDKKVSSMDLRKVVFNTIGGILGLLVGILASIALSFLHIPIVSNLISFVLTLIFIYLGYIVFDRRSEEILRMFSRRRKENLDEEASSNLTEEVVKSDNAALLIDTSAVIDGRILDVLKTGFITGKIIIPNFVILELQLISDSSDHLKRAKGRRGLDLVNQLKEFDNVEMSDKDYKDIKEVDTKLLRYAVEIGGKLITTDFNLNKVAEIQGVQVLNINDLANAVKTQLVVGEEISATIIRSGSERRQGVAYLPDGTMIVIEDTADKIDQTVRAEVVKVLQTSAGRMIFAELVK